MRFQNKILYSIWGVVLSLLAITFVVINIWARSRIAGTFSDELRTAVSTVRVHERLQAAQLIRACVVVAESPRLRAVAELEDPATASQLLQELSATTQSNVSVLTDKQGRVLVQLLNGRHNTWEIPDSGTIENALSFQASTDVWPIHDAAYRIVTVPIAVETDLVGTLTMGFPITRNDVASLKRAINCDIILAADARVYASTLDSSEASALVPLLAAGDHLSLEATNDTLSPSQTLTAGQETYLASAFPLRSTGLPGSPAPLYVIVKPLSREIRKAMGSMMSNFGLLSVVFLILTTAVGMVISRSITRPIAALVTGTNEITRGNYNHVIDVRGKDELAILARGFTAMSSSLKEQIARMASLNHDLRQRNLELDDTLQRLRTAQVDLVRSERLAATGKMTAQLAHEINNPIHNIQSCLQTALHRLPSDIKGRDLIETAYGEAGRLSRLTAQMLNLYRSSLVEDVMKPTNINHLLAEVLDLTRTELATNGIVMESEFEPTIPPIMGSRDKLKQVFLNLIANAADAMPEGGRLHISTTIKEGAVRVVVRDTGIGIPPENRPRIFDAFFTTKGKVSGVGLGLSVSYGIISQHRGNIEVESVPGEGSTFTVVFPFQGK
jgi:signal transduction histidine kinase